MSIEQEKVVKESSINWTKFFFMSLFFGMFGVDRFLARRKVSGILKLLTGGGLYIWWFIDLFTIASGKFTDSYGRRVSNTATQRYVSLSFVVLLLCSFSFIFYTLQQAEKEQQIRQEQQAEKERQMQEQQAKKVQELLQLYKQRYEDLQKGVYEYKSVKIGKQIWMAENLAYNAPGSRCYEDDIIYCYMYGRLYDWKTAMKACPKGWHLPTKKEWDELYRFIGDTNGQSGKGTAGKYLKATSRCDNNGNGTDNFGFSALPGGFIHFDEGSEYVGIGGWWWTATEYDAIKAFGQSMHCDDDAAYWQPVIKNHLKSVRCIKN